MAIENPNVKSELPPLLPCPRQMEFVEGTTTLSSDVRLSTRDVLPFIRKSMRGIFSAADIRVVANKKKFIIQVNIVDESEIEMDDIPATARDDSYEMEIIDNLVTIRSASQIGAAWGVQTFADIYTSAGPDVEIPNVKIRDWSCTPLRGVTLPCNPALERMRYDEFTDFVDRIVRAKCNLLGIDLFNALYSPGPERTLVQDTLLVPVVEEPPEAQMKHYRWRNPETGQEETHEGFPPLIEAQGLTKLFTYVAGKGVALMPGIAFPAKSKVLTTLFPELSAKNATGDDAASICCLSSDEGRAAVNKLIDAIFESGLEEPPPYFKLNLNTLPPTDDPRHWCQCDACKDKTPAQIATEFISWFIQSLTSRGINKIVLSQTDAHHAGQILTDDFLKELASGDLAGKTIVHAKDVTTSAELPVLVPSSTAFGAGSGFSGGLAALLDDTGAAIDQGTAGILADTRTDAESLIAESIMALHSWAGPLHATPEAAVEYAARNIAPSEAQAFNKAALALADAISGADTAASLISYFAFAQDTTGLDFAALVLTALNDHSQGDLTAEFEDVVKKSDEAAEILDDLIAKMTPSNEGKSDDDSPERAPEFLTGMRGEAAFTAAVAAYFLAMLPHAEALDSADAKKALVKSAKFIQAKMAEIEENKSRCAAAADLCALSALLP